MRHRAILEPQGTCKRLTLYTCSLEFLQSTLKQGVDDLGVPSRMDNADAEVGA